MFAILALISPILIVLLLVFIPVGACGVLLVRLRLRWLIATQWRSKGIRYLVAYSDNEHWKDYFEREVLPALGSSVCTINLSQEGGGKRRADLGWRLYRHVGVRRDRYPVVCRVTRRGGWEVIRFYQAFLAARKGRSVPLERAKAVLASWIRSDTLLSKAQNTSS